MPDPPWGATEGVRGYVTSSARGRKDRDREVQRGGAVDRGSTRTALHSRRERPHPSGCCVTRDGRDEDRSWRFAVKRSSTWWTHPTSGPTSSQLGGRPGSRWGETPNRRPRVSRRTRIAGRRKTARETMRDQESNSP